MRPFLSEVPFSPEQQFAYAIELAAWVHRFHVQQKKVHLDIRPENIQLDPMGRLVLAPSTVSETMTETWCGHFQKGKEGYVPRNKTSLYDALSKKLLRDPTHQHGDKRYLDVFSLLRVLYFPKKLRYPHPLISIETFPSVFTDEVLSKHPQLKVLLDTSDGKYKPYSAIQIAAKLVFFKHGLMLSDDHEMNDRFCEKIVNLDKDKDLPRHSMAFLNQYTERGLELLNALNGLPIDDIEKLIAYSNKNPFVFEVAETALREGSLDFEKIQKINAWFEWFEKVDAQLTLFKKCIEGIPDGETSRAKAFIDKIPKGMQDYLKGNEKEFSLFIRDIFRDVRHFKEAYPSKPAALGMSVLVAILSGLFIGLGVGFWQYYHSRGNQFLFFNKTSELAERANNVVKEIKVIELASFEKENIIRGPSRNA